ncbi:low temperature requirement protein A [Deinococcus yavapaiensis]|nr:low temperature requirement protein A [Deinococcus yavapaiensis]
MEKNRERQAGFAGLRLTLADAEEAGGRRATWLELFFDLVFVVAIGNLAKVLLGKHDVSGVLVFLGLFVPVWWAWIGISYFVDKYQLPEVALRLLMLTQIAFSLGLAVGLLSVVKGHPELFVASYVGLRLTLTALHVWASRAHEEGRELNAKYAAGFAIGTALWAASLAVDGSARYWIWGVAIVLEIVATVLAYTTSRRIPAQVSHMDERFGLFTIIVLGESVIAVASGAKASGIESAWPVAAVGLMLAGAVWWLYFDRMDHSVIDRALRSGRRALLRSFVYGYSHLAVFASIVATSMGVELAFEDAKTGSMEPDTNWLLYGGLAVYLAALTVVQSSGRGNLPSRVLLARAAAVVALVALGFVGSSLSLSLALLLGLLVVGALVTFEHLTFKSLPSGHVPHESPVSSAQP